MRKIVETRTQCAERLKDLGKAKIRLKEGYKYIDVTECAKMMGIHSSTVYALLRAGRFEGAIRLGTQWRIPLFNNSNTPEAKAVEMLD